jgi:hypothetical protein
LQLLKYLENLSPTTVLLDTEAAACSPYYRMLQPLLASAQLQLLPLAHLLDAMRWRKSPAEQ